MSGESREKKLITDTILLGFGYVVPLVVNLILLPIYTTYLSRDDYGLYDLVTVISNLLITLATLQIKQAGMRFLIACRSREDNTEAKRIVTNVLSFICAASGIVFIITLATPRNIFFQTRILIGVYFVSQIFLDALKQLVRGLGRNKDYVAGVIVQMLSSVFFVAAFLFLNGGKLDTVLFANALSLISACVFLFVRAKLNQYLSLKTCSLSYIKKMLGFSMPIAFSSFSMWIVSVSDRFIITFFLGPAANGLYAAANKIPNLLQQAFSVFNLSWQENASLSINDKDSDKYFGDVFNMMFNIMIGISCIMAGVIPVMFKILVNVSYDQAYYQMPILVMAYFFASMNGYFGNIFFAINKTIVNAVSTTIGAVLNLIIDLVLVNRIGLFAASISTLVSYAVLTVIRFFVVLKWKNMHYDYKNIIIRVIVFIFFCMSLYYRNMYCTIARIAGAFVFAFWINRVMIKTILGKIKNKMQRH
ncbi:MAG: oligosaccharide flippase family protein [Lachnospiraceae bacterium]|nr:oligosaccharide flippase family protein [Lachnospiraceae bacterium]